MDKNDILIHLSESEKISYGKEDFALQSHPQKVFSAIWFLEAEVENGGFAQYFTSDGAETVFFVVEAFTTIGAPKAANTCGRAIAAAFPVGLPSDAGSFSAAAGNFTDETLHRLDLLDREFLDEADNLTDLLFAFVLKHPEEFGTLPTPLE